MTVLRTENGVFITSNEIERNALLHNSWNKHGKRNTPEDCGEYSLYNQYSDIETPFVKAGVEEFGENFKDLEWWDDLETDYINDLDCNFELRNLDLGLSDKEEEILQFIKEFEAKNAVYVRGDYFTIWDGSKHVSIVTKGADAWMGEPDAEELTGEEAEKYLGLWSQADDAEWTDHGHGLRTAVIGGYTLETSQREDRWDDVRICPTEDYEPLNTDEEY